MFWLKSILTTYISSSRLISFFRSSGNYLFLGLSTLLLANCTGERCIDADDFGHSVVNVSARYASHELEGEEANQVAPWIRSGHRINGRPLTMIVKDWNFGTDDNSESELSAWCPWYGSHLDGRKLSPFCERLPECIFTDDIVCNKELVEARIENAPCLLKRGIGLYALLPQRDVDPNRSLESRRNPLGIMLHLGEDQNDYDLDGMDKDGNTTQAAGRILNYNQEDILPEQYAGSDLYFKILDRFYDDNSGQYRVVIKSGINNLNADPISYVTMLVKQFLFGVQGTGQLLLPGLEMSNADGIFNSNSGGVIKRLYLGVVNNPGYQFTVSALLTLYVAYTALSYLTGNIEITHTELIVRIAKIAIISALLKSQYSWSFFNDYLFVYFVGGVDQILNIIMEAGATGPGSPGIFAFMIAPQTLAKLVSLLLIDWLGWLYIILFILALYFVIMVFFKAAVIYLTALIAIGIIIIMAPIFLCFLLFDFTKSLFENWLKQLISYALQPIILFTGLVFISIILKQEFYSALGFRVCKQGFPQLSTGSVLSGEASDNLPFSLGNTIFYWWFPKPMTGAGFTRDTKRIPIPIDHYASEGETGDIRDGFCEAYACIGERYPDLPFLDPEKDKDTIESFHNGQFVHLSGLLLIFATLYLLHKFNDMAVGMSKSITGTSGNLTNIENMADSMRSNTFGKVNSFVASLPSRAKDKAVDYVDRQIGKQLMSKEEKKGLSSRQIRAKQKQYGKQARLEFSPSSLIDKARINRLKKESLTSGANKAILSEVKRKTGLSKEDINPNAIKDYQEDLNKTLKKIGYNDKQAKKLAKQLVKKKPSELKDELSKAKFGKDYDKLDAKQQATMRDLYNNNKKLRRLSAESDRARRFRTAYANAYADMSDRGIGIIGKRNLLVRKAEEIKHSADEAEKRKKRRREHRGENIIAARESIKNFAFSSAGIPENNKLSLKYGGGAYHNVHFGSKRKTTYGEEIAEKGQQFKYDKINRKIERYNYIYGENVTSPEFLARAQAQNHPKLRQFTELQQAQTHMDVEALFKSGDSPAISGDKYMAKYAKDSEMSKMADKIRSMEKKFYENDEYIGREDEYRIKYDLARETIEEKYQALIDRSDREDIKLSEMVELTRKTEGKKEAKKLEEALSEYNFSQAVLNQINHRKENVHKQADKAIERINHYRVKAGMEVYQPQDIVVTQARRPLKLQRKSLLNPNLHKKKT